MNKFLSILLGLVLLAAVVYIDIAFSGLWSATKLFLIGGVIVLVALIGLLFLLLGISELRS